MKRLSKQSRSSYSVSWSYHIYSACFQGIQKIPGVRGNVALVYGTLKKMRDFRVVAPGQDPRLGTVGWQEMQWPEYVQRLMGGCVSQFLSMSAGKKSSDASSWFRSLVGCHNSADGFGPRFLRVTLQTVYEDYAAWCQNQSFRSFKNE